MRIAALATFQPEGRVESFEQFTLWVKRAQVPQSCSLTLRNRNPNQIVRLHFMHQNWPKRVIETSIWDIECSNPSKYHKFALILVIFSNICPTKRLPWTLTEWVCVPEVEINDCIAYYMVLFNFLHKNLKSTVFYRKKRKFNGLFLWNFIILENPGFCSSISDLRGIPKADAKQADLGGGWQQWTTMDNNGQQWTTMDNNGQQWTTMDEHICGATYMPFLKWYVIPK